MCHVEDYVLYVWALCVLYGWTVCVVRLYPKRSLWLNHMFCMFGPYVYLMVGLYVLYECIIVDIISFIVAISCHHWRSIFHHLRFHIICFCKLSIVIIALHLMRLVFFVVGMANLELIDPVIDAKHCSHLVDGQLPPALRLRTHNECWSLDGSLQVASWVSTRPNPTCGLKQRTTQ